jgi:hypothetical protein
MTLRGRINRLEARHGDNDEAEVTVARDRLLGLLARLEASVVASGDASDRPNVPLIERAVRRYLRGDASMSDALSDLAERRWP